MTVTDEGVIYIAGRSDSPKGPQACIWFQGDDPDTPEVETWVVKGTGRALQEERGQRGHRHRLPARIDGGRPDRRGLQPDHPLPLGGLCLDRQPGARGGPNPADGDVNEYIGYIYDLEYILIKTGAGEASLMGSSWILNEATGHLGRR